MTVWRPRPTAFVLALAYTAIVRLTPYALMRIGFAIEPDSMAYPWNFSPALAFCIYGGAALTRRTAGIVAPLALYLVTDLGIWAISGRFDWAFYPAQFVVYGSLVLCAMCGWLLRGHRSWLAVAGCSFAAPCLFFLTTNFACWIESTRFPQTLSGLILCYEAAVPFHRNLLISTVVFSGVLFSPLGVRAAPPIESHEPQLVPNS